MSLCLFFKIQSHIRFSSSSPFLSYTLRHIEPLCLSNQKAIRRVTMLYYSTQYSIQYCRVEWSLNVRRRLEFNHRPRILDKLNLNPSSRNFPQICVNWGRDEYFFRNEFHLKFNLGNKKRLKFLKKAKQPLKYFYFAPLVFKKRNTFL